MKLLSHTEQTCKTHHALSLSLPQHPKLSGAMSTTFDPVSLLAESNALAQRLKCDHFLSLFVCSE